MAALRHAKSLLCFHLAQNPGINSEVKAFWRERLRIAPKQANLVIDIKRDRDDLKKPLTDEEKAKMSLNEIKIRQYKAENFQQWLLEEAAKIQHTRQLNKVCDKIEVDMQSSNKNDLTISRVLGHAESIPGSG